MRMCVKTSNKSHFLEPQSLLIFKVVPCSTFFVDTQHAAMVVLGDIPSVIVYTLQLDPDGAVLALPPNPRLCPPTKRVLANVIVLFCRTILQSLLYVPSVSGHMTLPHYLHINVAENGFSIPKRKC